jgi:hypothetical protein
VSQAELIKISRRPDRAPGLTCRNLFSLAWTRARCGTFFDRLCSDAARRQSRTARRRSGPRTGPGTEGRARRNGANGCRQRRAWLRAAAAARSPNRSGDDRFWLMNATSARNFAGGQNFTVGHPAGSHRRMPDYNSRQRRLEQDLEFGAGQAVPQRIGQASQVTREGRTESVLFRDPVPTDGPRNSPSRSQTCGTLERDLSQDT